MTEEAEARLLLNAAHACVRACRMLHELRPLVHRYLPEAYECIDQSMAAQLELLSQIMLEYHLTDAAFTGEGAEELGREPESYEDAVNRLGDFLEIVEAIIAQALEQNSACQYAVEIETRALTFSFALRERGV